MKRWITILLTLAMLLTLLPASALAAAGESTDTFCSATGGQHSWRNWTTDYSASCTQDGQRSRVCGRCGYRQTEAIKKTGHSWGKWKTTVEASCARQGEQTRKCSVCGKKETRKTDKLAHTWGSWQTTVEATCTATGTQTRACKVCGKQQNDTIAKLPHTWGEWTVLTEPTDHSAGTRARTCQVCGMEQTEDFDPEGTLRRGDSGDAVKKLQEGLICYGVLTGSADGSFGPATEKAVMAAQEGEGLTADGVAWPQTQTRLGHRFGDWQILSEKTDFSVGLRRRVCGRCGIAEEEEEWPEPTYKRGDKGDGVKALQEKLNAAGYDCGTADGDFGGRTEAAVKALEAANGFTTDGIAWPGVQKWLESPAAVEVISTYGNGASAAGFLGQLRNGPDGEVESFDPLEIVVRPVGGDIDSGSGDTMLLSMEAAGGVEPYSYRWFQHVGWNDKEDRPMGTYAGSEEPELPVNAPGEYYCRVTDAAENRVYSEIAVVTGSLTIVHQPQNANLRGKESVMLYCSAAGGVPFDDGSYIYAWYDSADEQVSFADNGVLVVTEPGEYYCVVQDNGDGLVTSETVTVYVAEPLQCVSATDTLCFVAPEPNEIFAGFSGGVQPYTAEWKLDGQVIPTSSEIPDGVYILYRTIASNFGVYTCTVTDAVGNVAEGEVRVEYAQLAIAEQPQGGMLSQDGHTPIEIKVVMAEGQEPFTYYFYGDPERTLWYESDMEGSFGAYVPGEYYIHVEDAEGRWADTDKVLVQAYEFHIDALTISGPISSLEDYQTLTAEIVGGEKAVAYHWFREGDPNGGKLTDTSEPRRSVNVPGVYHCEAEDESGNIAISPSVKVEYTGDVPIITRQPQDVLLPYSESGDYSAELSCLAQSGSPTTAYHTPISYTWERKDESGWIYNREQGPTITVTEPGIYRCICRDTYSGQSTISEEAVVNVKMVALGEVECYGYSFSNYGKSREDGWFRFRFAGGIGPFTAETCWRYSPRSNEYSKEDSSTITDRLYDDVVNLVLYIVSTEEGRNVVTHYCPMFYFKITDAAGQTLESNVVDCQPLQFAPVIP